MRNENKLHSLRVWKGLKRREVFRKGIRWILGSDSNLDFWQDNWLTLGPLRQTIHGPLTRDSFQIKVKEVGQPGGWDWFRIQIELPSCIKRVIQATPIPLVARSEDKLAWKLSPKGEFDMKTTYLLTLESDIEAPFKGKWI